MKISPAPSLGTIAGVDTQQAPNIRSLKMVTNATTSTSDNPQELIISDNKEDETKPVIEATEPISPQFAALAKQRRALQQERRAFLEEKKAHEAASQGSDAVPLSRLKSEPLRVLLESGVTYEQLTEAILANQANPEINALKTEFNTLKEGLDNKLKENELKAEQQVLAEMRRDAERIIYSNDDFELVRETKSVPDVMRLIERTYRETGEVLEVSEALKLVEEELFKRNQKLVNTKKLQGLFNKQPEPVAQQQRPQGMRTLTNKDTASVPMSAKQRAIAAFYGTLKK